MKNVKCPYCGMKSTIPIVYGYPSYELFEKQKKGEIKFGGCEVKENLPKRYCIRCNKSFDKYMFYSCVLNKCQFSIGGYSGLSFDISIQSIINGYKLVCMKSNYGFEKFEKIKEEIIILSDWNKIWKSIFNCYIYDWKDEYKNYDIIDGTYWELVIEIIKLDEKENIIQTKSIIGENQYPVYFDNLLKIFSNLVGENE